MQLAKHWRLKGPRYRLEGVRDPATGAVNFPPAAAHAGEPVALSGRGVIESFTAIERSADGFTDGTLVALVRLQDGPLLTAQLTDTGLETVQIGMPVEMVTRKLRDLGEDGLIVYSYKFRPLLDE